MSIYGTGVDLCEIARIEKSLSRHGELFANKILHANEKQLFAKSKLPAKFLAKRFAAKEAFAKAMGTGIAEGVSFTNIEVFNQPSGQPQLQLHGSTLEVLQRLGTTRLHLSISDERTLAIAQVIIEQI